MSALRFYWRGFIGRLDGHAALTSRATVLGLLVCVVAAIVNETWLTYIGLTCVWAATAYTIGRFHGWRNAKRQEAVRAMEHIVSFVPLVLADAEEAEMPDEMKQALQGLYREAQEELSKEDG